MSNGRILLGKAKALAAFLGRFMAGALASSSNQTERPTRRSPQHQDSEHELILSWMDEEPGSW